MNYKTLNVFKHFRKKKKTHTPPPPKANNKECFIHFLKSMNALERFKENILHCHKGHAYNFEDFLTKQPQDNWLFAAFSWQLSPEGHDYWKKLDQKWHDYSYDLELGKVDENYEL